MNSNATGRDDEAHRAHLLQISREIAESHALHAPRAAHTDLVLMEVDPHRLHAYWHIEHSALFRARVTAGDACASLVLRVREWIPGAGNGETPREYPVRGLTDSLYFDAPTHGMACFAEIGLKLRDGVVQPLVVSNIAHPPRAAESPEYEMIPVDTRENPELPAGEFHLGEAMPGPLPATETDAWSGELSSPGSSWHGPSD